MNSLFRYIPLQSFTSVLSNKVQYVFCDFHRQMDSKEILYFGENTKANIEFSKDSDYYNKYMRESVEIRNTIISKNVPTFNGLKNKNNYLIYEKININLHTYNDVNVNIKYNLDILIHEQNTNEVMNKKLVNIDLFEIKFEKNNYPILLNLEQYYSSEVLDLLDYVRKETTKHC
jgi:hypothetical protein